MKQYVIDQLRPSDYERIRSFLDEQGEKTVFGEIYNIELPKKLYNSVQAAHGDCQPYYFSISLSLNKVAFELLIRSQQTLRCQCVGYATREQREHIIDFADGILTRYNIRI